LNKIKRTLYVLSLKEFNLDTILYRYLWSPFKWIGNQLNFMNNKLAWALFGGLFILGIAGISAEIPPPYNGYFSLFFAIIALSMILKGFTERGDAQRAWLFLFVSQLFIALSIAFNEPVELHQIIIYLSGSSVALIIGYVCLNKIKAIDNNIDLNQYHGYSYEQPKITLIFLLSGLGVLGFPITPTFLGIDILFTHIHANQLALIIVMALNFLFLELAIFRIYTRVFLGQHKKAYHPIAFKSS
jgi:NADH-quinone oxidoreductase subunit L